jgi:hypothetical protein
MNGLAELITAAKYWQEWSNLRLVVAVLNNHDLNQVTWEMRAMSGAGVRRPGSGRPGRHPLAEPESRSTRSAATVERAVRPAAMLRLASSLPALGVSRRHRRLADCHDRRDVRAGSAAALGWRSMSIKVADHVLHRRRRRPAGDARPVGVRRNPYTAVAACAAGPSSARRSRFRRAAGTRCTSRAGPAGGHRGRGRS